MTHQLIYAKDFFRAMAALPPRDAHRVTACLATLQTNPHHPSLRLERIASTQDLWSVRASDDIRLILYQDRDLWAVLHVAPHDDAYAWARRRRVGRNVVTGTIDVVEIVERTEVVRRPVVRPPGLFDAHDDAYLLSLGVHPDWLPAVREVRTEDALLTLCTKLPPDVGERLLALAAGEFVTPPTPVPPDRPATEAPDTRRRFLVVDDEQELRAMLRAPHAAWIGFLHPTQRDLVARTWNGPVKVTGSAGTGKTVVAMHRARHLAKAGERVLLTSFVTTLCHNLERNLALLCSEAERARITVATIHAVALDLVRQVEPDVEPASPGEVHELLETLRQRHAPEWDAAFVQAEWEHVVRQQGIASWDAYRTARRTGRGTGLPVRARKTLWRVFGGVLDALAERKRPDFDGICTWAEHLLTEGRIASPFTAVVVDEVQDLRPAALRLVRALSADHAKHLMLCGDTGQRIYPGGFTLRALGIDVRGRSRVLRINYRTTEQIRRAADRLLDATCDDMDGDVERRDGTRSLLRGPEPELAGYPTREAEIAAATGRIRAWLDAGIAPEAIGVFARTGRHTDALATALQQAGIACWKLARDGTPAPGVRLGTMHRAKGLEFRAVLVLGCSADLLPHPKALEAATDPADREETVARERRLLYVAMTRARDELAVTWSGTPSPLLAPLLQGDASGGGDRCTST